MHRGVDGVTRAERFATALAGTVAGVERVGPLNFGLDTAFIRHQQTVADRERASLIKLDGLITHRLLLNRLVRRR